MNGRFLKNNFSYRRNDENPAYGRVLVPQAKVITVEDGEGSDKPAAGTG